MGQIVICKTLQLPPGGYDMALLPKAPPYLLRTPMDRIYPDIDVVPASGETLVERALAFALGGLEAVAKVEAGRPQ